MITLLYTLLIIFIWNEFFYLLNKERLDLNFKDKKVESMKIIDLVYYTTRFLYWIFIILGIRFSKLSEFYLILFIFGFIKFPIYHISRKIFKIYDYILPVISIIILLCILTLKIIG